MPKAKEMNMPIDSRTAFARPTILKTNEPAFRCSRAAAEDRKNWPPEYASPTDRVESAASTTRLLRAPSAEETGKPEQSWPDYLEALEAIKGAAQTLTAMEDHSQKIQAKAFELTQQAKTDRLAASQQIASLQQQLATSEARIVELDSLLAEAELRADTALEWLKRFLEAINGSFSAYRIDQSRPPNKRNAPAA